MATIGIVHFATHGHVLPATRLARVLADRGHRVVALAPESYREETEAAGATLRPLGESPPPPPPGGLPMKDGNPWDLQAIIGQATTALTPAVVETLHEERADVVVNDAQAPWGRIAAEWLGLPRACSWPLFPPKVVKAPVKVHEPSAEAVEALEESHLAIGSRWGVALGEHLNTFETRGDVNIVYSTPEIVGEAAEALDESWRLVGPLMDGTGAGEEPPLPGDDARPLVYAALGSVYAGNAHVFRLVLDALAEAPVRVLLSTWRHLTADDLAPVPDNATVVPKVDPPTVLRRAALHITHGGAGSAHESVVAGVPMVFLPQGSDNAAWAERFVALGAGELADGDGPAELRERVLRLVGDGAMHERTRALAGRIAAHGGSALAAGAIESLAERVAR